MLALALTVVRLRRHVSIAAAWGVALVGALWLDPFAAASLGFWLSFGAVGALIWSDAGRPVMTVQVRALVAERGSFGRCAGLLQRLFALAGPFLTAQWVVTLVLAPLLAASVGLPAWASLPVNAIAIPLFSVVLVPAVLLATLAVAVAPLVAALDAPVWAPMAAAWWVHGVATALGACVVALRWCAALPGVYWSPAAPSVGSAAVALVLALVSCVPLLSRRTRAGAAVACAAVLLWPAARPVAGGFQLQVLDVGQGSAAVIETAHHALVFDPGPAYGPEADAGGRVVVPFLRAAGWQKVSTVVVSHADADHSAGLGQVLQRFPAATVWWGGDGGAAAHGRQPCRAGLRWELDGVEFTFLHPGSEAERDDNSGSCVLLVRAAGRTALLLADIPRRIEDRIVAAGPLPVDIVLVAHHGSATASGEALRTATRVKEGGHAVVSAGYRNRWAFPKPAVRAGWLAEGRRVWVTAEEGALQFAVAPSGALRVASLRRLQPRWWRPAAPSLSP
jgi:competence protein ComEC